VDAGLRALLGKTTIVCPEVLLNNGEGGEGGAAGVVGGGGR
jgi:hypothetical protein